MGYLGLLFTINLNIGLFVFVDKNNIGYRQNIGLMIYYVDEVYWEYKKVY